MNYRSKWVWLAVVPLFAFVGTALAQGKQQSKTLLVNGYTGEAKIVRIEGHEYVDIRDLARITNSSLSSQENFVVFTLPAPKSVTAAPAPSANPPSDPGFSRDFKRAGIEATASMREWRTTLAVLVRNGYPVGDGILEYSGRARDNLTLASAAASTPSDQSALQLLTNEFNNVETWSDNLVSARNSADAANYAITDYALADDPLFQKIVRCGQFLGPMLASGYFEDDTACH